MPRSKTGKKRVPVDAAKLITAAQKVLKGELSIRQSALNYNVSKTTLIRHITLHKNTTLTNFSYNPNNKTKQVFSQEEEISLKNYLLQAGRYHYGLTKNDIKKLAFQFAQSSNVEYPKSWENTNSAGKEWLRGFLLRHSDLPLCKPEATSIARSTSFNKINVAKFFENYKNVLARSNFPSEKIWNCDETGVTTVHVPPKIIGPKSIKQLVHMTSGGQNITIIAAINAIGNHIPPMMIFPRVNFKKHMLKSSPPGTIGGANVSGLSNDRLFLNYLKHFKKHTKPTPDDPVILICDNHDSHVNIDVIDFCKKNGIIMLTFHPHTSYKMQPLERTVFGPLILYYNQSCSEWMTMNAGSRITIYEIGELVGKAFPKAFTTSNILKGFEVTGIYPFNENIFNDYEFLTSYVTDRPLKNEVPIPSTISDFSPESSSVTPEMLRLYPKAPPRQGRKGKSRILTDTPVKEEIAVKNKPAKKKILKKL